MRTLQEKYNAIQEGKFSKEHFLAEARMQQPQLITRFNGYDDAIQILKNRGMIQEVAKVTTKGYKGLKYEIHFEAPKGYKVVGVGELEKAIGSPKFYETLEKAKERAESDIKDYLGEKETVQEARLTKNSLTDYRYKPTNEMDKYPYEQILRGIRVELEGLGVHGTPTAEEYSKALAKVSKNLAKDSIFYTNQVAGVNPKVDLHDKMVPFTDKAKVDTFNGMKKAELKEAIKGVIKNIFTEESIRPLNEAVGPLEDFLKGWETDVKRAASVLDTLLQLNDIGPEVTDSIIELVAAIVEEGPDRSEDLYEMQGAKEDSYYKNELAEYLDDNGIFGYTKRIHDIMTGPDEAENVDELVRYLEDNQIYGYNRGIEQIYADYPYDQHWMNQPDEDEADDISHPRGYEEDTDAETEEDLFESVSLKDIL
jgi:hypothetical protein